MARAKKTKKNFAPPADYWASFEDYLRPKNVRKQTLLLFANKGSKRPQLQLKLLEHPVLNGGPQAQYLRLKERLLKIVPKTSRLKDAFGRMKFNRFLSFLLARNDEHTCKRKSGFEIYCEMASIHGFTNFVGATTLQRVFWFLVVLMAVVMSGSVLLVSHLMNAETPTNLYAESTQYPIREVPFPALTICNLNKISKFKAERLAKSFQQASNWTTDELTNYFKLALFSTENIQADASEYKILHNLLKLNNLTVPQLLQEISPNCEGDLLKCSFLGNNMRCSYLFRQIQTAFGQCCSFNYDAVKRHHQNQSSTAATKYQLQRISNSGYINGLTVLLDPHVDDYKASSFSTSGFHVLIHNVYDFPDEGAAGQYIITASTFNNIRIRPEQTYATEHISSLAIRARKCYLPGERMLFHFGSYSLANCLAECRSLMFFERCKCALPYRPKMHNWTMCGLHDAQCYVKYSYLLLSTLKDHSNEEEFICDCYPSCDYNMYSNIIESGQLSRKYSLTEKHLYANINVTSHILLRAYVNGAAMERLRLDASENWLAFLGNFGGIVGLHMGYSFLSGFELIFFVIVRPACNWWTKRRIAERARKRRRRAEKSIENCTN